MSALRVEAAILLALIVSLGVASCLWAKAFLSHPDSWNRLLARWNGARYLGRIEIHIPRAGNTCGPMAMRILLQLNGIIVPFESLCRELLDRPQGTSVRRMKEVAQKYGFRALAKRVSLGDVSRLPLPSIALIKRRHFVVVEALASHSSMIILDPSIGRCKVGASRFLKDCNGEMLLFLKNAECPKT